MSERLIDSVIIIDHLNGMQKATDFLRTLEPAETSICVITRVEILCGIQDSDREAVLGFLDQHRLLEVDRAAADQAAASRKKFAWKLPYVFQGVLAQNHQIKLTTCNTKDFNPKKQPFVEIPYTL